MSDQATGIPVPLIALCPCGAQAKRAVAAVFQLRGNTYAPSLPVCEGCMPAIALLRVEAQVVPTHADFMTRKTTKFPPTRGEVFVPALVVSCPACAALSTLDPKVFAVTEEGIKPSFICRCGFHGWLKWAPEPPVLMCDHE